MVAHMVPNPSYETLHARLLYRRGKASAHPCARCGEPATDWAYDHTDPNERTDPQGLRPYSLDLSRYVALCRTCHRDLDRRPSCSKGHEFTTANTYVRGSRRYCRECRRVYSNAYYHSHKTTKETPNGR